MRTFKLASYILLLSALMFVGCKDDEPTNDGGNQTVNRGNYDASRHVGIGVSLTAGYQNNALYEFGQRNSYDYLVAVAAHGADEARQKFQIPAIANPGLSTYQFLPPDLSQRRWLGTRVEVNSPGSTQTIINAVVYNTLSGILQNNGLNRPFNNLGISGSLAGFAQNVIQSPTFEPEVFGNNPFYHVTHRLGAMWLNKRIVFWHRRVKDSNL